MNEQAPALGPGWKTNEAGQTQWRDGNAWGPLTETNPAQPIPQPRVARKASAIGALVLSVVSAVLLVASQLGVSLTPEVITENPALILATPPSSGFFVHLGFAAGVPAILGIVFAIIALSRIVLKWAALTVVIVGALVTILDISKKVYRQTVYLLAADRALRWSLGNSTTFWITSRDSSEPTPSLRKSYLPDDEAGRSTQHFTLP